MHSSDLKADLEPVIKYLNVPFGACFLLFNLDSIKIFPVDNNFY